MRQKNGCNKQLKEQIKKPCFREKFTATSLTDYHGGDLAVNDK
jgi:hypothetical protein